MMNGSMRAAMLTVLVAHSVSAQKPPDRVVVATTSYTSTPSMGKFEPAIVQRLRVPQGFRIDVFAQGLGSPRMMTVGDDGTLYVTRRDSGDVIALRDDGSGKAATPRQVVRNLPYVHGIALHGGRMYLATVKEILVADMHSDGTVSQPVAIVNDLPDGGQHPNRTIAFGADGLLYVSIGSTCNQCIETNDENATIVRMKPDGSARGVFARGLRNTVGWGWHPDTKDMWGMDHGMDTKGDDIPPEEMNKIQGATNYGWPYCYANRVVDKSFSNDPPGSRKEEFCPRTTAPVLTYQAHAAPIQMAFYTGSQFPADYRGDAFIAMRGSWNRKVPIGYKLVRAHFQNGVPVSFDDFVTGFLAPDGGTYYGRLAGVAVGKDGSLFLSDDTNGVIYRISYGATVRNASNVTASPSGPVDSARVATPRDTMIAPRPKAVANRLAYIDSLREPESVLHDAEQDVYFISNIDGPSTAKDGRAFISRVPAGGMAGKALRWIEAGKNGVILNAPKGMAIVGDTLWVADIDAVRAFNRKTGAPITSLDLAGRGAAFLNDVVVGGDGSVYVTDSEIAYDAKGNTTHPHTDRVFRIDGRRAVTIALEDDRLARPNGITWDRGNGRYVIVPFGGDTLWTWKPGGAALEYLASGPGQFDGVVVTDDGTVLVSSKATSSVYAVRGGRLAPVVQHVADVADIAVDARHRRLLVPLTAGNKVEIYAMP